MINRFKYFIFTISIFTSSLFAVNVTFNVDMSDVTVSPNGVHVAGSFQGWDPGSGDGSTGGTPLSDDDGDGVWSVTVDMAGLTGNIEFKYLNGNSWGDDESVTDLVCGSEGGNRVLAVPSEDTVLETVCFSECIKCDESYVTFHVDMAETAVAAEGIFLGGGEWHDNWQAMSLVPGSETMYMVKMTLLEGAQHYYKFNNGGCGDCYEQTGDLVAQGCGDPDNWSDRSVTVGDNDMMTPDVCYSSCIPCGAVTADVTFQADMTTLLSQGFDPSVHSLELKGSMNGWGGEDLFVEDFSDPNLYIFTKTISAQPNSPVEWKFKASPDDAFNNDGWETAPNRVFYHTGDQVLDAAAPHIFPLAPLQNDVTVEISATWTPGTLNANTGQPFVATPDTIIMNGSFLSCWCTWGNCMGAGCDVPVSPDIPRLTDPDGDMVYTGTLSLPATSGNVFTYKLGAYYPGIENEGGENGNMDNEAGFGADKTFYISADASGTVALETVFGDNNPANPFLPRHVTFHLDMNGDYPVSENGVHVAGNFQGWDPSTTELLDPDMDGIYSVTVEIPHDLQSDGNPVEVIEYKFVNGNAWGDDESVSDPSCSVAGGFGNRALLMSDLFGSPTQDISLDPVCLYECITCDKSYMTFHVDMAEMEAEAASQGVFLAGGVFWPDFHPMSPVEGSDSLYMLKVVLPEGSHTYKYNLGGNDQGYEDGGALTAEGCGDSDNWGDRTVVVGPMDGETDPFCYNSCTVCGGPPPVEANVTFQANLTELISMGWSSDLHFLELRGGINGWAAGDNFEEDFNDPNLYTITKLISASPGSMHAYKFKANPDNLFNNSGWETGEDRIFEFTGEDIVLPPRAPETYFVGQLMNSVTVQIHATWNMNTINANTGEYFETVPDTIIMNGDYLGGWGTWGNCMGEGCSTPCGSESSGVVRLTDADGNRVYAGTLTLPAEHANVLTYKLGAYYEGVGSDEGANGAMDNEAGFAQDKILVIPTDASGTMLLETVFGSNNPDNPWASPGGYLVNGGFEEGPAGWGSWPPELVNWGVTDMHAFEGMHSLKITPRDDESDANPEWSPVYQSFSVEGLNLVPGNFMHMEGHLMTPSDDAVTGNNNGYLFIEFFDAGWQGLAKYTSGVVDASSSTDMWHHMMVSGVVPEGSVNINAGCELWQGPELDAGAVYFDNVEMMVTLLSSDEEEVITPKEFALLGNYPNPFNPVTTLRFDLDITSNVNVTVYNILGNKVITLQNGELNAGRHSIVWRANNNYGQKVPSGLYLYKVTSDKRILTGKMLLMK